MSPFKYRIAYLITPIEFGGAEKVSLDFLRNVDRDLFEICPILFFRPWEDDNFFLQELTKENFSLYKIPVSFGKHDYLWLIRRFKKLFSFLRQGRFDLLHTHGYAADVLGISSAEFLKIPTISTCHGFVQNDKKVVVYNSLDRFFLRFCDRIIAVSNNIRNILLSAGIKPGNIKVIPNAVATNIPRASFSTHRQEIRHRFAFSENDFVLGYVGRLSREKGLFYLINGVSLACKAGYPAKLFIVGEGSQKDELRAVAEREGVLSHVVFAGFQGDVSRLYPAMDAFVLPSLTEGTPMALLEAMAYGIPPIASSVGQIPEIIDSGKSGLLITPRNSKEICDRIVFLHNNPLRRKSIGRTAQEKIRDEFDIKPWVKRIELEYIDLIEGRKKA